MALSANIGSTLAAKYGEMQAFTAGGTIWRGSTVAIKQTTGLAHAAEDDPDDSEKQVVVGVAQEAAVVTGTVRVRQDGKWKRKTATDFTGKGGSLACVKDDETVQLYGALTCQVVVGRITEIVSTTEAYIDFTDRPSRLASGAYD